MRCEEGSNKASENVQQPHKRAQQVLAREMPENLMPRTKDSCDGEGGVKQCVHEFHMDECESLLLRKKTLGTFLHVFSLQEDNLVGVDSRTVITIDAYFSTIQVEIAETVQRVPLFTLLSDIGGQLGEK